MLFTKNIFFLFFSAFAISCSTQNTTKIPQNDIATSDSLTASSQQEQAIAQSDELPDGFAWVENIEQIPFRMALPLAYFKKEEAAQYERGKFVFKNMKNKKYELSVQGFFRNDALTTQAYFEQYDADEEARAGKIIDTKKQTDSPNCFYQKGGWSNFYDRERFVEIVWLRKDEVVKMTVDFDIADTARWNAWLPIITKCKM
jgi:hypothetical protein